MTISILRLNVITSIFLLLLIKSSIHDKQVHSRQKRILWVTTDGRLALPPGTSLVITPSLSLPFVRYPPDGFHSNLSISLPFTIDFNKLGLTDNENPYGVVPPILARSMGRAAGSILADYIGDIFEHKRNNKEKRSLPDLPSQYKHAFHGGERAILYLLIEDLLENFGLNGKACLLRAICEIQAHPLKNFGLIGEILKLFFSASKSPFADMLKEYVEAENAGKGNLEGPAECWPYMKECPKSIFQTKHHHYSEENNEIDENEVQNDKVTHYPVINNM